MACSRQLKTASLGVCDLRGSWIPYKAGSLPLHGMPFSCVAKQTGLPVIYISDSVTQTVISEHLHSSISLKTQQVQVPFESVSIQHTSRSHQSGSSCLHTFDLFSPVISSKVNKLFILFYLNINRPDQHQKLYTMGASFLSISISVYSIY